MIGNHLLEYRLMKDHQEQLLSEGQQLQRVHATSRKRPRPASKQRPSGFLGLLSGLVGRSIPAPLHAPLPATGLAKMKLSSRQLPSLVNLERALIQRLSLDACRRTRRLARSRAINRFARTHALWYDALFDSRSVSSLPDDYFKRNPSSLARSWAAQFPYFREVSRDRDVERLEPVAKDFLQILAEEEARLSLSGTC